MSNNKIPVAGQTPNPIVYVPIFVPKFLQCRSCGNATATKELNCFNDVDACIKFLENVHDTTFPLCLSRDLIISWDLGVVATRAERKSELITPHGGRVVLDKLNIH